MANEYFLKIDGIDGESKREGAEKHIDIESYSWGESQSGSHTVGAHETAGKVDMQPFSFVTKMSSASPKLFLKCATGEYIDKAVFIARKALGTKQETFLKWTLKDIIVSSYNTNGAGGDGIPMDSFTLAYTGIEIEYKPEEGKNKLGAAVTAGYDLKKMKKV
jgi:type VI secretion system secreted protein Hcp